MADFQFFLNRQGPRGPQGYKGDKGDDGKTPVPRTGTNTPIETTVIFDTGDGNPYETPNLKYPIEDRGGNMVMLDRTNSTQYYGTPDQATDDSYGVVKLATPESVLDDPLDSDVVTYELFYDNNQAIKTVTDSLAVDITQLNTDLGAEVANRTNADAQLTNKINIDVGNEATTRSNADTALSGRIDGLNTSKANKSDVYTKTQTDSLLNNKSNVGHTHNYNEITNKPDIGNGTITFKQGNTTVGTITTNQLSNSTLTFADPTGVTPGTGLSLDSATNTLSVKIDNDTLGINSDGEIEVQNAGTTYSEGDAIDLTNDTISVKYDNNTLKLNGTGQLYADIPAVNDATITITQGGVTKGSFTTNQGTNGTIALDAGPDMSGYYTKTQTDSLLDEKIDNDIVQYPLQYLPDTTDNLTYQNVNASTMVGSGKGVDLSYSGGSYPFMIIGTETGYENFIAASYPNKITLINNSSLTWFETELINGINFACYKYIPGDTNYYHYAYILGHYENNVFIPDALFGNSSSSQNVYLFMVLNNTLYNFGNTGSFNNKDVYSYYLSGLSLTGGGASDTTGNKQSVTIAQADADILNDVTHIRVYRGSSVDNGELTLSDIKVINPTAATPVTDGNYTNRYNLFTSGTNIFDAHPASLSLKYDNTTLGINANNELYALSSTPSNMVTTDTEQDLSNTKYFIDDNRIWFGRSKNSSSPWRNYNIISKYGFKTEYYVNNSNYGNIEVSTYQDKPSLTVLKNGNPVTTLSDNYGHYWFNTGALDGTTITYNSSTGKISAAASPSIATSSTPGIVQPDNSTITVDSNGVISAVNNSIAKTAPVAPLEYEETEDGASVGIGGTLNHTNYTSSVDKVYVYDVTVPNINNQSGDGYFTQSAANMMSKIFYKGYKIRLDNGLNIAWNVAESSGFFMNVAIGYYNNETFVPVLYALNDASYGGQMFARPAMELGSDIYSMGRLTTQFEECVGISLVGNVLNGFSPRSGVNPYTISDTTLLAEMRKCTHAICTVVNESSTGTSFNYSTGKFANPETSLITGSEAGRHAIFSAAENLILNTDTIVVPELKLNYDSNTLGVNASNELTVPTATSNTLGLVKPDGSTITINNGVISAAGSAPSNMVTTDTVQNITAKKNFTNTQVFSGTQYYSDTDGIQLGKDITIYRTGSYPASIKLGSNESDVITFADRSNDEIGSIVAKSQKFRLVTPGYYKKIYRENSTPGSNPTNFLLEKDMLDGTTLTYDSTTGKISATGGGSTPSNMVTTDTNQNITSTKTFNADCFKTKNILFNESGYSYGLRMSSGTLRYGQTSGDYSYMETSSIGVEASNYKHQLAANGLWTGTGTNNAYTQRIGLSSSGYSYLANNQGRKFYNPTYSSATSSFTPDANTPFFMTSDLLDGTYLIWDSTTNKITVDIQAIKDAIDALSSSSGTASEGPGLNPGGWE